MYEKLNIRFANPKDMENVFYLSNDEIVRANSINTEKIAWENHVEWFLNRINRADEPFYIVEDENGNFVGQVRFDKKDEPIISISITKDFRGKGLASKIIKLCSEKSKYGKIFACVKKGNTSSYKSFVKAGYKLVSENVDYYKLQYGGVYIIAEMSANHCGDINLAKEIITYIETTRESSNLYGRYDND